MEDKIGLRRALIAAASGSSRWRLFVERLLGLGLGCYLVVELGLVASPKVFIVSVGLAGLAVSLGAFSYLRRAPRTGTARPLNPPG